MIPSWLCQQGFTGLPNCQVFITRASMRQNVTDGEPFMLCTKSLIETGKDRENYIIDFGRPMRFALKCPPKRLQFSLFGQKIVMRFSCSIWVKTKDKKEKMK